MLNVYLKPIEFDSGNKVQLNDELSILNPFSKYILDIYPAYGCLVSKGFNRLNGYSKCWEQDSIYYRYISDFHTKYYNKYI